MPSILSDDSIITETKFKADIFNDHVTLCPDKPWTKLLFALSCKPQVIIYVGDNCHNSSIRCYIVDCQSPFYRLIFSAIKSTPPRHITCFGNKCFFADSVNVAGKYISSRHLYLLFATSVWGSVEITLFSNIDHKRRPHLYT